MSERRNILIKYNFLYIAMIFFGIFAIYKVVYFQFFYDKEFIAEVLKSTKVFATIEPIRGDIYSSDGKLLVTSIAFFEAGIDPNCDAITQKIFDENIDSLSICLSEILPTKTKEQYRSEIIKARDSGSRYYRFAYNINYTNFKKLSKCPILRKGKIKGGFVYQKTYQRKKLFGNLASRTLGTQETDRAKGVGLEDAFNNELKGIEGHTVKERLAGNLWMPIEDAQYIEPKDGYDLITTINIELQDVVETALERQLLKHDAEFGTAVLMEVKTGKVIAIANLKKSPKGYYYEDTNYAVGYAADPGSTFKLASVIIALEDGYVNPEDSLKTGKGVISYFGKKMKDTHTGGYGTITLQRAFELSSNVGISMIINKYYKHQPEKYIKGLEKLHLTEPLGVIIRGEAKPVVNRPKEKGWSGLSLTQMSIGYELQITPLQILTLYNAIANNGKMLRPIFNEALAYRGNIIKYYEPEVIDQNICSKQTLENVQKMLIGVVENGTAKNIKNENYTIAGKTGTAQMLYGKDSVKLKYHASFVGYFPAEDPEYSCIISIYMPKINGFYGGTVSAPAFKEIADKIYSKNPKYHGAAANFKASNSIPTAKKGSKNDTEIVYKWLKFDTDLSDVNQTNWIVTNYDNNIVKFNPVNYSDKLHVPNVINMGLKDAVAILEPYGLAVKTSGRGRIFKQEPAPSSSFRKGDIIKLYLTE